MPAGMQPSCLGAAMDNRLFVIQQGFIADRPGQTPLLTGDSIESFGFGPPRWSKVRSSVLGKRNLRLQGCSAVTVGSSVYMAGGECRCVQCFDLKTKALFLAKAPLTARRCWCGLAEVQGQLYAVGGADWNDEGPASNPDWYRALSSVERWDFSSDQWEQVSSMPTPRACATAVAFEDMLYVLGGCNGPNGENDVAVVEVFDPARKTWSTRPPMPQARRRCCAVAYGGQLYVIGGSSGQDKLDDFAAFDPTTQTWQTLPAMSVPRAHFAAALLETCKATRPVKRRHARARHTCAS